MGAKLPDTIPDLCPPEGSGAQAVGDFYEDWPYPKWDAPPVIERTWPSRRAWFGTHFPAMAPSGNANAPPEHILVAGGGSGLHPIETAMMFPDSTVLSLDLSRASLAYAHQKTRTLGVENLRFVRADIMALPEGFGPFDVIESVGVIQHTPDPQQALLNLVHHLRDGGLVKLGLYSKIARRGINRVRRWVREQGFPATAGGIEMARKALEEPQNKDLLVECRRYADFDHVAGTADLLFHIQEYQFTIPELCRMLEEAGLVFAGFEGSHGFASPRLEDWEAFENKHPDTFINLYKFWAIKPG